MRTASESTPTSKSGSPTPAPLLTSTLTVRCRSGLVGGVGEHTLAGEVAIPSVSSLVTSAVSDAFADSDATSPRRRRRVAPDFAQHDVQGVADPVDDASDLSRWARWPGRISGCRRWQSRWAIGRIWRSRRRRRWAGRSGSRVVAGGADGERDQPGHRAATQRAVGERDEPRHRLRQRWHGPRDRGIRLREPDSDM